MLKHLPWWVNISPRGQVILRAFLDRVEHETRPLDFALDIMPIVVSCVHEKYKRLPWQKRLALSLEVTNAIEGASKLDNLPTTGWRQ